MRHDNQFNLSAILIVRIFLSHLTCIRSREDPNIPFELEILQKSTNLTAQGIVIKQCFFTVSIQKDKNDQYLCFWGTIYGFAGFSEFLHGVVSEKPSTQFR